MLAADRLAAPQPPTVARVFVSRKRSRCHCDANMILRDTITRTPEQVLELYAMCPVCTTQLVLRAMPNLCSVYVVCLSTAEKAKITELKSTMGKALSWVGAQNTTRTGEPNQCRCRRFDRMHANAARAREWNRLHLSTLRQRHSFVLCGCAEDTTPCCSVMPFPVSCTFWPKLHRLEWFKPF